MNTVDTSLFALQNGSDIRGIAIPDVPGREANLLRSEADVLTQGFVAFLEKKWDRPARDMKIAVGCDSRLSGPYLKQILLLTLELLDVTPLDCGLASTPAMFMATKFPALRCDGAIMITASHLPYERNGFKYFDWDGGLQKEDITVVIEEAAKVYAPTQSRKAEELDMQRAVEAFQKELADLPPSERIEAYKGEAPGLSEIRAAEALDARTSGAFSARSQIQKDRPIFAQAEGQTYVPDLMEIYAAHLRGLIEERLGTDDHELPLAGLHITVDAGNGAGGFFATDVLEPLGADISGSRYLSPDGTFPHHAPNPEDRKAVAEAKEAVLSANADIGLIFDTDVDRSAAVTGSGREVARNGIVALAASIVAKDAPGSTVVTDSITSTELTAFLTGTLGLTHLRYKRGYKNVINKARALNAEGVECALAIETSGHAALKENFFLDDGAYLAMKIVMEAATLRREGRTLDDLLASLAEPAEAVELRMDITAKDYHSLGDEVLQDLEDWVLRRAEEEASGQLSFAEDALLMRLVTPNYEGVRIEFFETADTKKETSIGWCLLRKSLHDPLMPLNIEAARDGGVARIAQTLRPFFDRYPALDSQAL